MREDNPQKKTRGGREKRRYHRTKGFWYLKKISWRKLECGQGREFRIDYSPLFAGLLPKKQRVWYYAVIYQGRQYVYLLGLTRDPIEWVRMGGSFLPPALKSDAEKERVCSFDIEPPGIIHFPVDVIA